MDRYQAEVDRTAVELLGCLDCVLPLGADVSSHPVGLAVLAYRAAIDARHDAEIAQLRETRDACQAENTRLVLRNRELEQELADYRQIAHEFDALIVRMRQVATGQPKEKTDGTEAS